MDRVPFPVYECTSYAHRATLSLYQLDRMATLIEKKDDGRIGFRRLTANEIGDTEW